MYGYMGTVLRVNLSNGKITKEPLDMKFAAKYIGGRGFISRILYDTVQPDTDPLGPDNPLLVSIGPCCGTEVPGSQRYTIAAKSPLTGFIGHSNSGGLFGSQLKYAGYDTLIIEGQAKQPVYLWLDDDKVEIRPAEHLWGKTTREAKRQIWREVGSSGIGILTIGIGGENLVKFASIIGDLGRGAGKTGMGTVLGSKKVKAIAARGSKGVKVACPEELAEAAREHRNAWASHRKFLEDRFKYGPFVGWRRYRDFGMVGARNFQQGTFPEWKRMEEEYDKYFLNKNKACFSCPAGCDHLFVVTEGPWAGTYGEGFELSGAGDFGPRIGNSDLALACRLTMRCDEYSMDYFETSSLIAFVMECFQRGILTEEDIGFKAEWGNPDASLELVEMIAHRKGIGNILADGVAKAAKAIGKGSEKYAMHVKGLSLVMRDVRAAKAWGLGYAVASRGACHVTAHPPESYTAEHWDSALKSMFSKYKDPTNPLTEEGKPDIIKWYEDLHAFMNCMEICIWGHYAWMGSALTMLPKFYNSVVGANITGDELRHIGERIVNVERAFNLKQGLTRRDDTLPDRMTKEPLPDGPAKGQVINIEPMVSDYYELRGWSRKTGFPTRKKLTELGLEDIAEDLERIDRLS